MKISLDATYSVGDNLSGVGIYSRALLAGLPAAYPKQRFEFCYRPHRFLRSFRAPRTGNCGRALLLEPLFPRSREFFHGLNQRLPGVRFRKTVSTFHDLFVLTGDYSTPEFRRRFADQARDAAARSDAIIAVSEFTALQVEQLLQVERARLHVVHHGTNMPASRAQILPRENIILNVGALQRRKNIARLVEAFERTPQGWKLILAGSAGYGAAEILARINASPRRQDIQAPGYVSAEDLAGWYARARIFAFPSLDEGFGMPALEAMAAGVPVVASNHSAMPEVCGDAAILVDPEDTAALADAIERLMRNEDLAHEFIQRGRQRAAQFSWEKAVKETWKVYEVLLG